VKRAALAALLVCSSALADPGDAFRAAQGDIDALEQLGAERPVSAWTDDAWIEAAQLAERSRDLSRAKRDLEQAIAISDDSVLTQRAKNDLARISGLADWTAVTAEHERLLPSMNNGGGDPRAALAGLEQLVRANPRYPRASTLMVQIATAWAREGESEHALDWLVKARAAAATPADRVHANLEYVRMLIRTDNLREADDEIARLDASPRMRANLREQLEDAKLRQHIRWVMQGVLVVLALLAAWKLRGRYRRLLRPPLEVIYMLPIGVVLVVVSATGNPLVARAIRWIVFAGIAIAWVSGSIETKRRWLTVALAVIGTIAAAYIAVDRGPLVELLRETWRER
jgi:tetratricopeptide (TPR) repeat protein